MTIPARVLIVEDQPPIRKDLERMISGQPGFAVVGSCGSVTQARRLIEDQQPDILLLDIHLTDGSGFDILVAQRNISFKIIFLTAHHEYAIRAIKADAIDYLLKPADPLELKEALDKAVRALPISTEQFNLTYQAIKNLVQQHRIALRCADYVELVDFDEILYCHSVDGYTTYYLTGERKLVSCRHMKQHEEHLPAPWFLRTHQSYIVNHQYIARYQKDGYLILKDGTPIPVSWRRKEIVLEYFNSLT